MLEEGKFSPSILFWLITGFTFGSSVILPSGEMAEHNAWLAVILGMAEGLVFTFIYISLNHRFPEKTMVEICETVYGSIIGKIVASLFLWYLFHLGSFVIMNFTDFFRLVSMPETPSLVFGILITLACIYAVKHGIEVIGRCSQILVPYTIGVFILMSLLILPKFKPENFLPFMDIPFTKLLKAGHSSGTFPFGETVAFIMIIPFLEKKKKTFITINMSLIFAGVFLVFSSLRTYGVLGNTAGIFTYPAYQVGRLIDIGDFFSRLEIIIAINFFTMGFLKISVLLYGTVLGTAQLLKIQSYRILVIPVAILMLLLSIHNFSNVPEGIIFLHNFYPIYAFPFQVIIPLMTLLIAMIRKLPGEKRS